jgi:hypothetical protein
LAVPKQSAFGNFVQALMAVLVGNAAYFLLMPYLPPRARHRLFQSWDLGMIVDFWFCLVAFGIVKMIARRRGQR